MLAPKVVVTGASGYLGSHIFAALASKPYQLVGTVRAAADSSLWSSGDISAKTDWSEVLVGAEAVIHTANLAHRPQATAREYQRVNVEGTMKLARQALELGVKRFIFISSASVYGEGSDYAYYEETPLAPVTDYGRSKAQAESALLQLFKDSDANLFLLRLPMVVGTGAPGNFSRLVSLVERGFYLPFGSIANRRSLVGLESVTSTIERCLTADAVGDTLFNVADAPVSTAEIIEGISEGLCKPTRLLPCPTQLFRLLFTLLGKSALTHKLLDSHYLNTDRVEQILGVSMASDTKRVVASALGQIGESNA